MPGLFLLLVTCYSNLQNQPVIRHDHFTAEDAGRGRPHVLQVFAVEEVGEDEALDSGFARNGRNVLDLAVDVHEASEHASSPVRWLGLRVTLQRRPAEALVD